MGEIESERKTLGELREANSELKPNRVGEFNYSKLKALKKELKKIENSNNEIREEMKQMKIKHTDKI